MVVTDSCSGIAGADRLVLPGVGAFADGMSGINKRGLSDALHSYFRRERPFLGICLGMQMLLSHSSEFGDHPGLGAIPGSVIEIPRQPGFKVPHMGWNRIHPRSDGNWDATILADTAPGALVYFVHSFTAVPNVEQDRLADADYGGFRISAAVQRHNVIGTQFHPEKSGATGLAMLKRFVAL